MYISQIGKYAPSVNTLALPPPPPPPYPIPQNLAVLPDTAQNFVVAITWIPEQGGTVLKSPICFIF
jgi:hypothetical protein